MGFFNRVKKASKNLSYRADTARTEFDNKLEAFAKKREAGRKRNERTRKNLKAAFGSNKPIKARKQPKIKSLRSKSPFTGGSGGFPSAGGDDTPFKLGGSGFPTGVRNVVYGEQEKPKKKRSRSITVRFNE